MKRTRILILISVVALQSIFHVTLAQFTINDKAVVYNATDSIYMCAISDSLFASDYLAHIHPDTIFKMDQYFDTIGITYDTLGITCDTIDITYDTLGVTIDTIVAYDTLDIRITIDTILVDSAPMDSIPMDSIPMDSIPIDTIITMDTIVVLDTIIMLDTITLLDTILSLDTIFMVDTIIALDTISWTDTLVWHSMRLNDTVMHVNDSIIFEDVRGNKVYHLNVYLSNGDSMCVPITFTNLPIVVLEGDFGYDYVEGLVHVYHPDSVAGMNDMSAKIKWRGGSTNVDGKHKRNYTMKFLNEKGKKQKRQFFGLRTSNYWILNAGQIDLSRCRNLICHELWQDMASKPYYIDQAPDAITNSRGRFVEVILNQEYRGLYSMCENVDQEQMQIKEYDEDRAIIHGQLWKTDSWNGTGMTDLEDYNNNQETYRGYETKYPDFDDVKPTDYSTLYHAIDFVVNSSDQEFEQHVEEYFDVPVLIDYYLFVNVLVARDNNGKNLFWACYDKQKDKKLTLGVWDLDCTVGQNYTDKDPHPDSFGPQVDMRTQQMRVIARLLNIPHYANAVQARYKELAPMYLNTDSLIARFETYFSLFERGGASAREELRWSGDTDVAGLNLDFQGEFEFMKNWIKERFDYLNNGEFKEEVKDEEEGDENGEGNEGGEETGLVEYQTGKKPGQIYNLFGVPVNKPLNAGIYIQNGKKIIIK